MTTRESAAPWVRGILTVLLTGLAACGGADTAGVRSSSAALDASSRAARGGRYLALGDSVPAGYTSALAQQYFASLNPANHLAAPSSADFLGYPEILGAELRTPDANPACPGETTASFLDRTKEDNGCAGWRQARAPLHVAYASASQSQMAWALDWLAQNGKTAKLVTLTIGANDMFLMRKHCEALQFDAGVQAAAAAAAQAAYAAAIQAGKSPADAGAAAQAAATASVTGQVVSCIASSAPGAIQVAAGNIATIIGTLRAAGYEQKIAVTNYYSAGKYDPADITFQAAVGLNQGIQAVVDGFAAAGDRKVILVDEFSAFGAASHGDPCLAGLIAIDPTTGQCEIHPSAKGADLLAETIEEALEEDEA
jgi:lysophospholipase L1-like esterase